MHQKPRVPRLPGKLRPTSVASGTYILKELRLCTGRVGESKKNKYRQDLLQSYQQFGKKELLTLTSIVGIRTCHNARNAVTTNHQLRITSHSGLTSTAAHGISFPQPTTSNTPPPPDKLPQWPSRRHTAPAVPPHPIEHLLRPTPSSVLVQATYNPSSTSYPTTGDSAVHPGKQHDHVRPRRLLANAAIHDAGRGATHADGEDLYFYTLVPSSVSSASTSSGSATSELCSASEESSSESDSEGKEEDAQAYTERTTDFAMRHTPAAADFAQPRAHRPMVYLSSPASAASDNGRESDERDAELTAPTITPSTTPAAATRSPGPWSRRKGCAGCASSLPRRSPNPPRMRTGRSSSRSQYRAADVTCAGGRWSPSRYQDAAQQAGVYQGGGQQQQWTPSMQCTTQQHQQQAHQQQHTAPTAYAATHVTPAPAARRPACMHDDAVDAPAPRVRGGRARAVDAATAAALCGLGAVESGGGGGGSVACPAGPLARPCAARAPSHTLP
ncbi:hypothetical protein C8J57DRAFT_1484862 [Mycena rebaudengoi]|nr:hypothetical protein C8J57DRAFT_1484862 [Mycena rebaudengoi]